MFATANRHIAEVVDGYSGSVFRVEKPSALPHYSNKRVLPQGAVRSESHRTPYCPAPFTGEERESSPAWPGVKLGVITERLCLCTACRDTSVQGPFLTFVMPWQFILASHQPGYYEHPKGALIVSTGTICGAAVSNCVKYE